MAGYRAASGDIVVTLEDDGQSPPSEYEKLLDKLYEGFDVVYAQYGKKKQSRFRNTGSKIAAWMGRIMMDAPGDIEGSSFFAARRFVVDDIVRYDGPYTFVHGLILRSTKRLAEVPIEHRKRAAGKSGYNLKKLVGLWMNGFTTFSVKPLRFSGAIGVVALVLGIALLVSLPFAAGSMQIESLLAYLSITVTTIFSGLILVSMWLLGEYVGRSYLCLNKAPQFVVRSTLNFDEQERNRVPR